jgi:hypothetical protein
MGIRLASCRHLPGSTAIDLKNATRYGNLTAELLAEWNCMSKAYSGEGPCLKRSPALQDDQQLIPFNLMIGFEVLRDQMQSIPAADYSENLGVNCYNTEIQKKSKLAVVLNLPTGSQQPKRDPLEENTLESIEGCKVIFPAASPRSIHLIHSESTALQGYHPQVSRIIQFSFLFPLITSFFLTPTIFTFRSALIKVSAHPSQTLLLRHFHHTISYPHHPQPF